MKNLKTRAVLAAAGAITIVGLVANPAAAFYNSTSCSASGNVATLTNYSKGSGQEYHWSTTSVSGWRGGTRIYVNGVQVASGGSTTEGFRYYSSATASYTWKFMWWASDPDAGTVSCSRTL